jgi:hypothetical protein
VPNATAADGTRLHYEETGVGFPVLFIHAFAGDLESWQPQLRFFGRRYRCIALQRARLSALGRAGRPGRLLAADRGRRRARRARRGQSRPCARRRALDGRLHDAAPGDAATGPRPVGGCPPAPATALIRTYRTSSAPRSRSSPAPSSRKARRRSRSATRSGRRASSSRAGIRAAGPSSRAGSAGTRRPGWVTQ